MSLTLKAECDDCNEVVYELEDINRDCARDAVKEAEEALAAHECETEEEAE